MARRIHTLPPASSAGRRAGRRGRRPAVINVGGLIEGVIGCRDEELDVDWRTGERRGGRRDRRQQVAERLDLTDGVEQLAGKVGHVNYDDSRDLHFPLELIASGDATYVPTLEMKVTG